MSLPSIRSLTLLSALCIGAAFPSLAQAQSGVDDHAPAGRSVVPVRQAVTPGDSAVAAPAAGPRISPSGISRAASRSELPSAQDRADAGVGAGSNVAMMGVGIAGIVAGSIVGGDSGTVIAVGGAVIGLIGLFRYLR